MSRTALFYSWTKGTWRNKNCAYGCVNLLLKYVEFFLEEVRICNPEWTGQRVCAEDFIHMPVQAYTACTSKVLLLTNYKGAKMFTEVPKPF